MDPITLPIYDWFVGDPFKKTGNCFVGSAGAVSLSSNAFCYRVWLERGDDGATLCGEVYDVLTQADAARHAVASFPGDKGGWEQLHGWLLEQYQSYLDQKRNELTVSFHNQEG